MSLTCGAAPSANATPKPFVCPDGYRPKEDMDSQECPNDSCTPQDCCYQTCALYKSCDDKTKQVVPGNICSGAKCDDVDCCVVPTPNGNKGDASYKNAIDKWCGAQTKQSLPVGTSPQYLDYVTTACDSVTDMAALPVIHLGEGIGDFGLSMLEQLLNNTFVMMAQQFGPSLLSGSAIGLKRVLVKKIMTNPEFLKLRNKLMKSAAKRVADASVTGAAMLVGLPLTLMLKAWTTVIGKEASLKLSAMVSYQAVRYLTLATGKGMAWLGEKSFGLLGKAADGVMQIGMLIDMLDPCDLNSAMTGAQLNKMASQMTIAFRESILGSLEAIPTTQNVSIPYDEVPLTADIMKLTQMVSVMSVIENDLPRPPKEQPHDGYKHPVDPSDGDEVLQLYHRYVALYLGNLKTNSQNHELVWPNNVHPDVPLPDVRNRFYATLLTLTNDNYRAADMASKYWYVIVLFIAAFVGALVLFFA